MQARKGGLAPRLVWSFNGCNRPITVLSSETHRSVRSAFDGVEKQETMSNGLPKEINRIETNSEASIRSGLSWHTWQKIATSNRWLKAQRWRDGLRRLQWWRSGATVKVSVMSGPGRELPEDGRGWQACDGRRGKR